MGTMLIIGVVAGVIVAVGTVASGALKLVGWISSRAREKDRERAERDRIAAELEDLKKRMLDHQDGPRRPDGSESDVKC